MYFTVLYVVFTSIREREETFAIYLITGIMFFHIFGRGTAGGLSSLTSNAGKLFAYPLAMPMCSGNCQHVDTSINEVTRMLY